MLSSTSHPLSSALLLAGPTATGKSEAAMILAERLGGEIISVDSMQVYRGLDIGTAKPTVEERRRVPHHLIDVVEVTESFDAAQFTRRARQAAEEIQGPGRVPILCGGTGLYFKALLDGLGEGPPGNRDLRLELEAVALTDLLQELEAHDPVTFATIDRNNPRRVIRAVEVIRLTGKPFSSQRATWAAKEGMGTSAPPLIGVSRSPADLHKRIETRVDRMFQHGLVPETERLLPRGLAQNRTALQAIGYRQVTEHLRGERSLAETIELVKIRTRQFAKRQMTWFRHQAGVEWVQVAPGESAPSVAERVERVWKKRLSAHH